MPKALHKMHMIRNTYQTKVLRRKNNQTKLTIRKKKKKRGTFRQPNIAFKQVSPSHKNLWIDQDHLHEALLDIKARE